MLRRARHPLTTTLLALALVRLLADPASPRRVFRPPAMPQLWVLAGDAGLTVLDPARDSMDRAIRALVQTPIEIAAFQPDWPAVNDWRMWRAPRRPTGPRIVTLVDPGWSEARLSAARSAVVDHLLATGRLGEDVAPALRLGPGGTRAWHPPSVLWNLGVWSLVGLWAWSLGWVPGSMRRWRTRRRQARLASGLCPGCRYPIPPRASRCPECGEEVRGVAIESQLP
ncbi:MAG: zinc ribbon domain-containing protein [Phycisphaerae bacterium]|nr:zinc ribbon domain-containing protein [Phycisphaerae bacterium]